MTIDWSIIGPGIVVHRDRLAHSEWIQNDPAPRAPESYRQAQYDPEDPAGREASETMAIWRLPQPAVATKGTEKNSESLTSQKLNSRRVEAVEQTSGRKALCPYRGSGSPDRRSSFESP
jgi:hypothetical protein